MAAVGGCAVLAGVAYILQGGTKNADDKNGHLGINICNLSLFINV